jgi:hypothetical protein
VDSCGNIPSRFLKGVGEHQAHGADVISTPVRTFERAMDLLAEDLQSFTFIDIGAGKGRAMLLAARRPFRRVLGVKYAPELAAAASRNFARYRDSAQRCRDLYCYCAEATTFELPLEPLVLYFLRPFDDVVMARFLNRVAASYATRPRKILILFVLPAEPKHAPPHDLFQEAGFHHRLTRRLPLDWAAANRLRAIIYEISAA